MWWALAGFLAGYAVCAVLARINMWAYKTGLAQKAESGSGELIDGQWYHILSVDEWMRLKFGRAKERDTHA